MKRGEKYDLVNGITNRAYFRELSADADMSDDSLTLTINTDRSPVFKSSKTLVRPIQFVLNELPPTVRFQNPVLVGLWFGSIGLIIHTFLNLSLSSMQCSLLCGRTEPRCIVPECLSYTALWMYQRMPLCGTWYSSTVSMVAHGALLWQQTRKVKSALIYRPSLQHLYKIPLHLIDLDDLLI